MALSLMFPNQQGVKQSSNSGNNEKKSLKRKMNRGSDKVATKSSAASKSSAGGGSSAQSRGGGGSRPRRVNDYPGFDADDRSGGREHIVDRRFFDGKPLDWVHSSLQC